MMFLNIKFLTDSLGKQACLILLFVLSGCTTLGPDYQKPLVSWLEDWKPTLYGDTKAPQAPLEATLSTWWHLFNDPVLNALIEEARRENHTLQIAGLRILESRAVLGVAGSTSYPQLQQLNGALAHVNSQNHGGLINRRDQSLTSFQSSLDIGWELDFWGRFKRGIESADAAYLASVYNFHDAQVLVAAQVVDLYFAYRATQLRIKIAESNAKIQERSFEISKKQYESGQESELDLHQAKTQYLATLSTIPSLNITLSKTRHALGVLLGKPPGALPLNEASALPQVDKKLINHIPSELLLRRPDLRASLSRVAAQSAQIGIAKADLYPSISLFGSISWSENDLGATPDVGTQTFGPAFKWNIFDYGRIKDNVLIQDARLEQLIAQYRAEVLLAVREIEDATVTILNSIEQQKLLAESVASSARALKLANTRYKEGYAGFQRVIDAQRAKFTQEDRELINQSAQISAVIDLYKSLGGGWKNSPVEETIKQDTLDAMKKRVDWGDKLSRTSSSNEPIN